VDSPIRFRQATHRYCSTLDAATRATYLSEIVLHNANALVEAIEECARLEIGAFRINSQLLPLATHPVSGYSVEALPRADEIIARFADARAAAESREVRLSFHPDQFVVLNSESAAVVDSSVREMNHQARVADLVGAEALTLHGGGKSGGSARALERLERGIGRLSPPARRLLALENDDRSFSPTDLLPFCERSGIPFVYDIHHHRCLADGLPVAEVTERSMRTWNGREAWMHISSPRGGWESPNPRSHANFIDPNDVPTEWRGLSMTIDVEAKEKERAVIAISEAMKGKWQR
jgi:UV DNA damage endonuclease